MGIEAVLRGPSPDARPLHLFRAKAAHVTRRRLFLGAHFLVEGGNRHFAHDVVGLRLITEVDNPAGGFVIQDGIGGRWSIRCRSHFHVIDVSIVERLKRKLNLRHEIALRAKSDVSRVLNQTCFESRVAAEEN